ncbi:hypothetical protein AB1Y20_011126 [Prymnesium parvum]|uniref:Uncharacterized protein n=1 Tax=Prymnesium parvum TaxID=97485 RepID=A0AB34IMF5_PRYPA
MAGWVWVAAASTGRACLGCGKGAWAPRAVMMGPDPSSSSSGDGFDMELLQQRMDAVRDSRVADMMRTAANWRAGRCTQHVLLELDDRVRRVRASNGKLVCGSFLGSVVLAEIDSGDEVRRWEPARSEDDAEGQHEVTALEFDGEVWAAGDVSGNIRVHSASHERCGQAKRAAPISGLCLHEQLLFSTSLDRRLVCWDTAYMFGAPSASNEQGLQPSGGVNSLAKLNEIGSLLAPTPILCMSSCMGYAALGLSSGEVLLCTLSPLRTLLRFSASESAVSSIHLVTTSQLVCGSSDGTVRIWRLDETEESGRRTTSFRGHKAAVVSVVGDTEKIVSGARDGTIRVWDIARGRLRFMLEGFTAYLGSVQLSPSWLIADGTNNNVVVKLDFSDGGAHGIDED